MPVEIRELQITAVVRDTASSSQSSGSTPGNASEANIIAECVEQVLEILKQKNDR